MPHSRLAEDAFLLGETGPVATPWLEPGEDRVWVVDRNGAFTLAPVRGVGSRNETDAWRVLTAAGDLVVPVDVLINTSDGPMSGAEIDQKLRSDKAVRVDVVTADDLPPPARVTAPTDEVVRSCLAALPGRVVQLPRDDEVADAIGPEIEELLLASGVRFHRIEDERWLAFVMEPLTATRRGSCSSFTLQADVLSKATAWAIHENGTDSRVRVTDHRLRRRLLAALVGAGQPFEVKWLPGYRPVDSRIRATGDRPWPARIPVHSMSHERCAVVDVDLGASGDPIVSLAVLGSGR